MSPPGATISRSTHQPLDRAHPSPRSHKPQYLTHLDAHELIPAATYVDALATIAALNVLLWAMVAYETIFVYDERRYRLRHGLEIDIPGSGS